MRNVFVVTIMVLFGATACLVLLACKDRAGSILDDKETHIATGIGVVSDTSVKPNDKLITNQDVIQFNLEDNNASNVSLKLLLRATNDETRVCVDSVYREFELSCADAEVVKDSVLGKSCCVYSSSGDYLMEIQTQTTEFEELTISSDNDDVELISVLDWGRYMNDSLLYILLKGERQEMFDINENKLLPMKLTYKTLVDDVTVVVPVFNVSPFVASYSVDCDADGVFEHQYYGVPASCHYNSKGIHHVVISGAIPLMRLYDDDGFLLESIDQWGSNTWRSMKLFMAYAKNAVILAKDSPDLSHVRDMSEMFRGAIKMNSNINDWDVSNVNNMEGLFMGTVAFNQPLDKWNTSGVINMTKMFANTHSFNQNINGWDVSKVKYMSAMFYKSERFNKPLDGWDVSSVEYMTDMFAYTNFNQPLRDWELASLKDARGMFETSEVLMNHKMFPGKLFSDYLFLEKVKNRMALIGRKCNVFYNDKFDAAKEQQIGDCFDCYMDDDVYSERP